MVSVVKADVKGNIEKKEYIEKEKYDELQKHCNGYAYDSLVYRYQLIRMKLAQYDAEDYFKMNGGSRIDARTRANDAAKRDIIRFGQILEEVMKEHD